MTRIFDHIHPIHRYKASAPSNKLPSNCSDAPRLPSFSFLAAGPNFFLWNASYPPAVDYDKVRRTLWHDWSPFWEQDAQVFVEKDIPNIARSLFLQSVFAHRSRHVLVVRHPLHTMHNKASWSITLHLAFLASWLSLHETVQRTLDKLHHHYLFQLEWLTSYPEECIESLSVFVGLDLKVGYIVKHARQGRRLGLEENSGHGRHDKLLLKTGTSTAATEHARRRNTTLGAAATQCIPQVGTRLGVFGYSLDHLDPNFENFFVQGRRPLSCQGRGRCAAHNQ